MTAPTTMPLEHVNGHDEDPTTTLRRQTGTLLSLISETGHAPSREMLAGLVASHMAHIHGHDLNPDQVAAVAAEVAHTEPADTARQPAEWLISGPALLAGDSTEPDWLIEGLVGAGGLLAVQGYAKTGKTWILLEIAIAVATGRPAFGAHAVAPGPVILVLEESPQRDTARRLSKLIRGHAQAGDDLHNLNVASNAGVRLSDPTWRASIEAAAEAIKPVLIAFDPLARVKGDADENEQTEVQAITAWMADLRTKFRCTVGFAHHTGHADKGRMRGSSDLEAWWSSKVEVQTKDSKWQVRGRHREAEDGQWATITKDYDSTSDSMKLTIDGKPVDPIATARGRILQAFRDHDHGDGLSKTEVNELVTGRAETIRSVFDALLETGQITPHGRRYTLSPDHLNFPSHRADETPPSEHADERDDASRKPLEHRGTDPSGHGDDPATANPSRPDPFRGVGTEGRVEDENHPSDTALVNTIAATFDAEEGIS
ncbi:AAA family ATPase [Paraconexibacter antarcticus]|uniref:AAA family ATPase n=1 Tax=Paraconexibacter antarcticus TaxID=2949664 RepID=A0ABY5DM66_9ACTN|nr:AAA family ATPase [Paraconexibacter antarcticus]UTI62636.1 AAA family ATPase [Paraconexibacter antarcticus]